MVIQKSNITRNNVNSATRNINTPKAFLNKMRTTVNIIPNRPRRNIRQNLRVLTRLFIPNIMILARRITNRAFRFPQIMVNQNGANRRHLTRTTTTRNKCTKKRRILHHATVSTRNLTLMTRLANITNNTNGVRVLFFATEVLIPNRTRQRITQITKNNHLHQIRRGTRTHRMLQHNGTLLKGQRLGNLRPIMPRALCLNTLKNRMVNLTVNITPLIRMVRLNSEHVSQRLKINRMVRRGNRHSPRRRRGRR